MPSPDDHFTAGPHCRVKVSSGGCVGSAGRGPTVCAGIVSSAGIEIAAAIISAPDDHFTAGPHCGVIVSASRSVGDVGWSPRVVRAFARRI